MYVYIYACISYIYIHIYIYTVKPVFKGHLYPRESVPT